MLISAIFKTNLSGSITFRYLVSFVVHSSDMCSGILSSKLAPFSVLFSYWKKTDQITSHCAGSLFYMANIVIPTNMMSKLT